MIKMSARYLDHSRTFKIIEVVDTRPTYALLFQVPTQTGIFHLDRKECIQNIFTQCDQ